MGNSVKHDDIAYLDFEMAFKQRIYQYFNEKLELR